MSGVVAIVANDAGRYTMFSVCVSQLKHPPGSGIDWALHTDIVQARNHLIRRALDDGRQWVFFLDDDHVFQGDLLMRLLDHDKPVVGALYLRRNHPFSPCAFSHRDEEGLYAAIDLSTLPREGLLQVQAVGTSGMLIRREVLEAVGDPWFSYGMHGEMNASEDINFCEKVRAAGFEVYVDLAAQLGHLSSSSIWPAWVDQEWAVGFTVADGLRLFSPIVNPAAAEAADAVRR